jgi:hypothetical protein
LNHLIRIARTDEKRRYRRSSASEAGFRVHCAATGAEAKLVNFSQAGLGLVLPNASHISGSDAVSVLLTRGGEAFLRVTLGIASGERDGAQMRIGGPILERHVLPFGPNAAGGAGDVAQIHDSAITDAVLARLFKQTPLLGLATTGGVARTVRIDTARAGDGAIPLLVEAAAGPLPEGPISLSFDLDDGAFVVRGTLVRDALGRSAVAGPLAMISRSRRHADRVRVARGRSVISWPNALVPGERITADVDDLSAMGARVRVQGSSSYPPPPGDAVLLHVDGLALPVRAEVRHVDAAPDGGVSLGLRFLAGSGDDTVRLARAVERIRFPGLRARDERPRGDVVELLRTSGYLDLRESAQELTPWHDTADAGLSLDAVHARDDGSLDGHISCTRVYSNTWIFHQLASLGEGPQAMDCRRALYLSVTNWVSLLSEGRGHALAYFDRKKRWHMSFFESFVRWAGSDALALLAPLDRFEALSDAFEAPAASPTLSFGLATEDELPAAEAALHRAMPSLLCDAMDMSAPRLATDALCAQHAAEGLERARTVLVVREEGRPVAFALCETGSPRLSLFNLLNMAHVVVDEAASVAAQHALLAHVRSFYAARGTARPLIVAKPGTLSGAEAAGLALAETMGCIVMSSEGLKQYRNFLAYSLRTGR